jgi:hypothetical protein
MSLHFLPHPNAILLGSLAISCLLPVTLVSIPSFQHYFLEAHYHYLAEYSKHSSYRKYSKLRLVFKAFGPSLSFHPYLYISPMHFSLFFFCFFIFSLYCCAGWEYVVAFTKVLTMYQIYLTLPPSPLSFIPSPPIPGTVSTGIIFAFTYLYTLFAPYSSYYFLNTPFPYHLSPSPVARPLPPQQNLFYPSVLQFCRRKNMKYRKKNMTFSLV